MSETEPLAADDPNLKYDDDYQPPPVHGIHATKPFVNDEGGVQCSVCGQVMLYLAPETLEHNTDRG